MDDCQRMSYMDSIRTACSNAPALSRVRAMTRQDSGLLQVLGAVLGDDHGQSVILNGMQHGLFLNWIRKNSFRSDYRQYRKIFYYYDG